MACIRKRRGKYVVDYRDGAGIRRWVTCETRRQAEDVLTERVREGRKATEPVVDSNITLNASAERWLTRIAATVKPRTQKGYAKTLRLHILPVLGTSRVRLLQKGRIKSFLAEKLREGKIKNVTESGGMKKILEPLARDSVRIIHATLRAMLNAAVDDGIIVANPADKLGRALRLITPLKARQEEIKAMTREQLSIFLKAGQTATDPYAWRYSVLLLLLARTGMRMGEALALQWEDVNFGGREIRVARAFSAGHIDTPKSGHGRTVDMSYQLARTLLRL